MKRLILILCLGTLALPSCRRVVFEERISCPSFLYFDIVNAGRFQAYEKVYTTAFEHPGGALMDGTTTSVKAILADDFYFTCRNTDAVRGYGVLGHQNCYSEKGTEWVVPLGEQFDSLFRFSYVSMVEPESFRVPVEYTKEHCRVQVQFLGMDSFEGVEGVFPFELMVRSNTCGIDVMTGAPVRGSFQYRPPEKNIGSFEFMLPRQADHDLRMELYGKEHVYKEEGHLITFDLWEMLSEAGGITWTEKNLPDIKLEINYIESQINIEVIPWDDEHLQYES